MHKINNDLFWFFQGDQGPTGDAGPGGLRGDSVWSASHVLFKKDE